MKWLIYLVASLWPWIGYAKYPAHNPLVIISGFMASCILVLIFAWAPRVFQIVRQDFDSSKRIVFAFVFFIQVLQIILCFPGKVSYDDLAFIQDLSLGNISPHSSNSYSLLLQASHLIFFSALRISILNLIFYLFVLFLFLRLLPKKLPVWMSIGICILFCFPLATALVVFESRDSINSILLVWWCLGLCGLNSQFKNDPWFHLYSLGLLTLVLGDMRPEGKIIVVLFPIAVCWIKQKKWGYFVNLGLIMLSTSFLCNWIPQKVFKFDSFSERYLSTTVINPLGYVFQKKGMNAATKDEQIELERFMSVQYLIEFYDPFEIAPYHRGGIKNLVTSEDFKAFQKVALSIIMRNPKLFLENRKMMASQLLNFEGHPYVMSDNRAELFDKFGNAAAFYSIDYHPFHSLYREIYDACLERLIYGLPLFFRLLLSSCLVPILVMFFMLFDQKLISPLFWLGLVNLVRLGAILFTTPASQFKYITSIWLVGWIMLIFLLAVPFKTQIADKIKGEKLD